MKNITSLHNEEVKSVAALKNSNDRYEQGRFVAEGERVISTFVEAGWKITTLYAIEALADRAEKLAHISSIRIVTPELLKKMSQTVTPSGLLAVFRIPIDPDINTLSAGLVLAHISDPGNAGTLMRTAAAMNIKTLVVVDGVDAWHPKVIQASAGAIAYLTIFQCTWQELIKYKGNNKLHALIVSGGKEPNNIDKNNALLVVGNEAHGLPAEWIADCDDTITIPMPGKTESLNAAIAGSIALYQVFK